MNIDLDPKNLRQVISGGESKWLEFKSNVPPDHVIAMHLVAFANTDGGTILFGIGDKGSVIGIPQNRIPSELKRLKRLASSLLPESPEIGVLECEGKPIIYLKVASASEEYRPLMTAQGEIYTRHADKIHQNKSAQELARPVPSHKASAPRTSGSRKVKGSIRISQRNS